MGNQGLNTSNIMALLELRVIRNVEPLFSQGETRILEEIVSGDPTSLASISARLGKNPHTVRTQLSQMRQKYRGVTGHSADRELEMNTLVAGLVYLGKLVLATSDF